MGCPYKQYSSETICEECLIDEQTAIRFLMERKQYD